MRVAVPAFTFRGASVRRCFSALAAFSAHSREFPRLSKFALHGEINFSFSASARSCRHFSPGSRASTTRALKPSRRNSSLSETVPDKMGNEEDIEAMAGGSGNGYGKSTSTVFLHPFAFRQWDDPNYSGTRLSCSKADLLHQVKAFLDEGNELVDGYAPFCKHLFIPNRVGALVDCLPIQASNRHLLQSTYRSRTPSELPVLVRWFPSNQVPSPPAKFLDVILYSREQLKLEEIEEAKRVGREEEEMEEGQWGIICFKAQNTPNELPMQPITMMRNALGISEGGSGVPLNRVEYKKSVEYWQHHAIIADIQI